MMSIDNLTDKQKTILENFARHRSPVHEVSLFKGIDINYLKLFKKHFRGMFIYRPRGGRYHIQNNCTMRDAKTFAIYEREVPNRNTRRSFGSRRYWLV